ALSNLLNGQADLSGEMALRIEKAFGIRMETLMRMQSSYDIVQTRQREKLITVRRYRKPAAVPLAMSNARRRRISFSAFDAAHMYEWLTRYWGEEPRFGGCLLCQQLGARLERFIGAAEARRIQRVKEEGCAQTPKAE